MSTWKAIAVWVLILGLTTASYMFFDAAEDRWAASEEAAKDAAWMRKMEAEMEKVGS